MELPGPQYLWPADQAWVVNTDYDLTSSYLACGADLAAALQADSALEVLPVTRDTRVDDNADHLNRSNLEGQGRP